MNNNEIKNTVEVKPVEIFGYGFGGLAVNLLNMVVSNYIIFFFTDVAGITLAAAGIIFTASKLVDAFADPLVGSLIDNTISKWGRMRPYMLFGSFLAVASMIALFTSTNGFTTASKNIYYFIIFCVWSVTYTIVCVPYQSSVSLISNQKNKRNLLIMSGKLVAIPAALVVANMHNVVRMMGGGQVGWQRASMFAGVIVIISLWICAMSTKRFDTLEKAKTETTKKNGQRYTIKERLTVITQNKPLFMLMIAFGTNNLASATTSSVQNYYAKYVLEDMSFISRTGNFSSLAMIPLFILVPFLCKKFSKRKLFIVGTIIHIIPAFVIGFFNVNAIQNIAIIDIVFIITIIGNYFCNIVAFMMVPDCIDFSYSLTGIVSAGLITSAFTFCNKISTALGGFITSIVLNLVGYNAGITQSKIVLMTIVFAIVISTIFSDICSLFAMSKYSINELSKPAKIAE